MSKSIIIEQLSKDAGVSLTDLYYYEKDQKTPNVDILRNIPKSLNVSADYLLGLTYNHSNENNEAAPKIKEGDLALFTSTKNFKKNDIVYVYLDNEAKIRRALPINDKEVLFQTIDTEKQDISKDYKVIGRFIGVIRMEP